MVQSLCREEGWIHHLARHAVACFLTRGDLWVSWEEGMKVRIRGRGLLLPPHQGRPLGFLGGGDEGEEGGLLPPHQELPLGIMRGGYEGENGGGVLLPYQGRPLGLLGGGG